MIIISVQFVSHPEDRICDQNARTGNDDHSCHWVTASPKQLKYLPLDKEKRGREYNIYNGNMTVKAKEDPKKRLRHPNE